MGWTNFQQTPQRIARATGIVHDIVPHRGLRSMLCNQSVIHVDEVNSILMYMMVKAGFRWVERDVENAKIRGFADGTR